jgi:hypothetical protein
MLAWFTFNNTNFTASRFGSLVSKAFNSKAKIKNPVALTLTLLTAAIVIVIIVFAMKTGDWLAKPGSTGRPAVSTAQDGATVSSPEAILITFQPYGFEPAEVTLKAEPFLLAVDNRSGVHEPVFRVDRVAGGRLYEVRMAKGRLAWRRMVDLSPGDYVLTEATHPDLVCRITITPR